MFAAETSRATDWHSGYCAPSPQHRNAGQGRQHGQHPAASAAKLGTSTG